MTAMDRKPGSEEREGGREARGEDGERKMESARRRTARPRRSGAAEATKWVGGRGRRGGERDPMAGSGNTKKDGRSKVRRRNKRRGPASSSGMAEISLCERKAREKGGGAPALGV